MEKKEKENVLTNLKLVYLKMYLYYNLKSLEERQQMHRKKSCWRNIRNI
jgi:hypothetical protein